MEMILPLQGEYVDGYTELVLCTVLRFHHNTRQVTNLGALSPVRTIQIVLTTAPRHCAGDASSWRQVDPAELRLLGALAHMNIAIDQLQVRYAPEPEQRRP